MLLPANPKPRRNLICRRNKVIKPSQYFFGTMSEDSRLNTLAEKEHNRTEIISNLEI